LKPDFGFKFFNFVSKELQLLTSYRIAAKSSRINLGLGLIWGVSGGPGLLGQVHPHWPEVEASGT
jgi:hypothetical protein